MGVTTKIRTPKNNYSQEIQNLIQKANLGDNKAQYSLSKIYTTGNDEIDSNAFFAYKYLILAAINDSSDAQYDLATVYADGSSKMTKFFIDKLIYIPGLGIVNKTVDLVQKKSTIKREVIASYWYNKAADNGNGQANYEIAKRLESGLGIKKDLIKAKEYYKKAYNTYGILDAVKKIDE